MAPTSSRQQQQRQRQVLLLLLLLLRRIQEKGRSVEIVRVDEEMNVYMEWNYHMHVIHIRLDLHNVWSGKRP